MFVILAEHHLTTLLCCTSCVWLRVSTCIQFFLSNHSSSFFFSLSLLPAALGLVCWQQRLWHQPWPRRPGLGALLATTLAVEPSGEQRPPLPLCPACFPTGVLLSHLPSLLGILLLLSVVVWSNARPLVCLKLVKESVYRRSDGNTDDCAAVDWFQETVADRMKPSGQRSCCSYCCFHCCFTISLHVPKWVLVPEGVMCLKHIIHIDFTLYWDFFFPNLPKALMFKYLHCTFCRCEEGIPCFRHSTHVVSSCVSLLPQFPHSSPMSAYTDSSSCSSVKATPVHSCSHKAIQVRDCLMNILNSELLLELQHSCWMHF